MAPSVFQIVADQSVGFVRSCVCGDTPTDYGVQDQIRLASGAFRKTMRGSLVDEQVVRAFY